MNSKTYPILLLTIFFLQGCTLYKTMEMSALLSPQQQEEYRETIISQKRHFVSLAPYKEHNPANGNTSFILFVKNCGEEPVDISSDNVSAEFFGNTRKWASRGIDILSHDDLMNVLELEGYSNEVAANSSIKTYSYYSYDSYGDLTFKTGTILEPGYHTAVASLREVSRQMQMVAELVLQPQTLQPGEGGGGLVVCETRTMNSKIEGEFHVVVTVNGEQHEFTFSRSLKK